MHKAGFVNIVGNPNVGKSTLMNLLVGERISIATFKAQTTRHRIMGILNTDDAMTGSLCLERSYGDSLAHEQIHQSRLSHIGVTHNIYKTGFMHVSDKKIKTHYNHDSVGAS